MNLFTMQHGPQPNGGTMAGSLEFLATARDQWDIASLTSPLPTTGAIGAERAEPGTAPSESLAGLFDLVIMNPVYPERYPQPPVRQAESPFPAGTRN